MASTVAGPRCASQDFVTMVAIAITYRQSLTLQGLKFIVAVAEAKQFGRAAGSCFINQPSLSVAIR